MDTYSTFTLIQRLALYFCVLLLNLIQETGLCVEVQIQRNVTYYICKE